MNESDLGDEDFHFLGAWRTPACLVHKPAWLRGKSGLYVFVTIGEVRYVGQASVLHRRLRHYSNRCFRKEGARTLRACHTEILAAIERGHSVAVYVRVLSRESDLLAEEAALIKKARPDWNRTHQISN